MQVRVAIGLNNKSFSSWLRSQPSMADEMDALSTGRSGSAWLSRREAEALGRFGNGGGYAWGLRGSSMTRLRMPAPYEAHKHINYSVHTTNKSRRRNAGLTKKSLQDDEG